jgi:cation:H+ antiporter
MTLFSQISLTIAGFAVMIIAADILVRGASAVASYYGVPPIVIGLTIVAYGTSMPEFMASFSAMRNDIAGIAVGNVLGSNVCNIALVIGVAALIVPVRITGEVLRYQLPITFLITVICMLMFLQGDLLSRGEGIILVAGLFVYTWWLFKRIKKGTDIETEKPGMVVRSRIVAMIAVVMGCIGLFFGGEWVIKGASGLAESFRVPARIIGSSVVALGTSLPELITTLIGIIKKQTDLGIGNAVGSCIFNILMVLGVTSVFRPVHAQVYEYRIEFIFCLLSILALYPLSMRGRNLGKIQGAALVMIYALFMFMIF